MPRSNNQKLKILYLMKLLLERTDEDHPLTMQQLLTELEAKGVTAERKSIYDDLETLRLFGLDVQISRGKAVGYYVADRTFELPELKLLVDAVQSSKFITYKKSTELIQKIESLASNSQARQLQRQVFVANRIKTMNESIYYTVDAIHAAINADKKIVFKYYDWDENKEKRLRHDGASYHVSPWALTWDDDNYYMIAYDGAAGKIKHYRVDKMLRLSVSDEKREGQDAFKNFDMGVYSKKVFGMYGGRDEQVTLRCKNHMSGIIIDRFGHDIPMYKVDSERFETTVRVEVSPHFLTWLMNFGTDVKIMTPQSVIDEFKALAQTAISQYES
ncbi:MAG TPA: WYL domain-containing protein [Oscillospiraceae bacterium]|nr:WYL domain-containing protein [Oscillospiraceae bacterium]HPF55114.1 WYL domain-containing protein [Clostridiales bacterium]HPK34568.1 WYL domain-containing protein [Oscillospiraceae bacterium]HPR76749.1 WYL domain-containing protein [Oscillospiraceae bacterium]